MDTKRITADFISRAHISFSGQSIKEQMNMIDANFKACNDILNSAGMDGINYELQTQEIDTVAGMLPILTDYVLSAPQHVLSELDEPFTKDFQDKVLPAITDISVRDIKTQCTYSAENHSDLDGIDNMTNSMTDIMEIGFENFLTLASGVPLEDMQSLENVRAIQIFTNLFREEFESQMAAGIRNLKGSLYYYLDDMPWKETFKSDSLNGTMSKPLVELITGRDIITGEALSNYERRIRAQQFKENLGNIGLVIAGGAAIGLGGIEIAALAGLATIVSVGGKAATSVSQKAVKELGGSDRLAEIYGFRAEVIARVLGAKLICDNYINPRIEVEMVGAVEEGISSQRIEYYLNQSRNNTGSDTAMLGSTGRYDVIAEGEGYAYFKMEDDLWSSLVNEAGQNYDEVWKVNQRFLDEQIELNKNILLTDDPSAGYYFPDGSRRFYQRELDYLTEKGYTFEKIKDGIWKAIRK